MPGIDPFKTSIRCPDCRSGLHFDGDRATCESCRRKFHSSNGIWSFLPSSVESAQQKEREKQAWHDKARSYGVTQPDDYYLQLPFVPLPYYEKAARGLKIVLAHGTPWEGMRVLELGAAECWATRHFAQAGARCVASDYSDDPERMGRSQVLLDHLPIDFARMAADAERLPFADESFDRVFCCSTFHHFPSPQKAASEIGRVLAVGGVFYAICEAIHPIHVSRKKALSGDEETAENVRMGINEQSFTLREYARFFDHAGMDLDVIHPWWDVRDAEAQHPVVAKHAGILQPDYRPRRLRHLPKALWFLSLKLVTLPMFRRLLLHTNCRELVLVARKRKPYAKIASRWPLSARTAFHF